MQLLPDVVCTEYPSLGPQQSHDALGEEVRGHVGVDGCQGVVKEID